MGQLAFDRLLCSDPSEKHQVIIAPTFETSIGFGGKLLKITLSESNRSAIGQKLTTPLVPSGRRDTSLRVGKPFAASSATLKLLLNTYGLMKNFGAGLLVR
jgi:hypothetical protein